MLLPLILWIVILVIVFPIAAIITVPLVVWRLTVNLIAIFWRKDLVGCLSSRDLVFTSDDFYGKARKNVISCSITFGSMSIHDLRSTFKERILDKPVYSKLKCRPILFMGYWFWKNDCLNPEIEVIEEKGLHTDQELKALLPKWVSTGYRVGNPLWAILMVPLTGDRTAVIIKLHHMVADGVSFMKLLEDFCDPGWTNLETSGVRTFSWMHWFYAWYNFPWKALKAYWLARRRKGFRPKAFFGESLTSWTNLSLDKLRVVRRHTKAMFPTVLSGIMSNAFHRVLETSGKLEKPKYVRVVIPTPWPHRPSKLCNHVAWIHADLTIGDAEVMQKFETSVKQSFISGMHGVMWQVFRALYLLPAPFLAVYTNWGETNLPPVVLSCIPGSLSFVSMVGNEVQHCVPILALGCSTGANACITTYGDGACFSLRVSKEVLPTQELLDLLLNKYLHEELDKLYTKALEELGTQELSNNNDHVKIAIPQNE
ncbi:unnamed protein product [Allacma fusca]|uniref:Diacylglycerol O-acyltransferase n=1 Tax=Allacma fusca TaxID=39272 RepID=A0A8J2KBA1_9HEXA|nr:unnamed protein product [Allacma fusca]